MKDPIIEIALDATKRSHNLGIANAKTYTPPRHVITLGKREELYPDILGARHLKKTGGLISVKDKVCIGKIMNHQNVMLFSIVHDLFKEGQIDHFGCGIVWKGDDEHLGPRPCLPCGSNQVFKKIPILTQRNPAYIPTSNDCRIRMDRVRGIGRKDDIPRPYGYQYKMRNPFFGANGNNRFGIRVYIHVKPASIPIGNCHPELCDPHGC